MMLCLISDKATADRSVILLCLHISNLLFYFPECIHVQALNDHASLNKFFNYFLIVEYWIDSQNLHMLIFSEQIILTLEPLNENDSSRLMRFPRLLFIVIVELFSVFWLHLPVQNIVAWRHRIFVKLLTNVNCHFFTIP